MTTRSVEIERHDNTDLLKVENSAKRRKRPASVQVHIARVVAWLNGHGAPDHEGFIRKSAARDLARYAMSDTPFGKSSFLAEGGKVFL